MKLYLADNDVTDKLDVTSCNYYDFAGGHADKMIISCKNVVGIELAKGQEIKAIGDNKISTGKMYINSITKKGTDYVLKALSTRTSTGNIEIFIKNRITFYELAKYVADYFGYELVMENIKDYLYAYKEQIYVNKLRFFARICELEGILLKIKDNKLILVHEKEAENAELVVEEFQEEDFVSPPEFTTNDADLLSEVQNTYHYGNMLLRRTVHSGINGKRILTKYMCSNYDECERICKNILRKHNKNEFVGSGTLVGTALRATDNISISTDDVFSGRYFIYCCINDFVNERQRISFRKPIEGDY